MVAKKANKNTTELDVDDQLEKLGKRIAELRKKAGYTNADFFAYDHGIHRSQYGRYENGSDLRFSSLVKIVNAFGMTMNEFFSEGFE